MDKPVHFARHLLNACRSISALIKRACLFKSVFKYAGLALLISASGTSYAQSSTTPIQVDVIYPKTIETSPMLELSGSIEAKHHAQLAPLEAGRVDELLVEVGDVVSKGQTLLRLDDALARLQVEGAKASLEAAKVNFAEAQRLYKEVLALSEKQLVAETLISERAALLANAEATLAREEANLALQEEILKRHSLKAPFDGVIAMRNVDMGEWISQQTFVFELVDMNDLRLVLSIPQEYYRHFLNRMAKYVEVRPDATNSVIQATVNRVVPVGNNNSRTFSAFVDLPRDAQTIAGMSARARIRLPGLSSSASGQANTQILLPRSAVKQHPDGGSSIFVVEDGKAKRIVTPYKNMPNGMVSIENGESDKAYIISGIELLKDGAPVKVNDVSASMGQ
uniref:efflux RND transporter periplasmic adaptor subunit n=1 Tax=Ningiella ruwaisensis TaxID=2364274 RepID=UPI0010A00377|nr:efflux RND transporter periplasmic adaptor subunit [Ningiella ruwaisensis]